MALVTSGATVPEVGLELVQRSDGTRVEAAAQWTGTAECLQHIREVGFELHVSEAHRTGRPLWVFIREPFQEFVIPIGDWAVLMPGEGAEPEVVAAEDFWNRFALWPTSQTYP